MMEDFVNANLEAVVTLPLRGPAGQEQEIDAVIDTGFNGFLTLPPMLVADLGLPVVGDGEAVLADGREASFNVYGIRCSGVDCRGTSRPERLAMRRWLGCQCSTGTT